MLMRDFICQNCGYTGMLDSHCENIAVPIDRLFRHLGHNPFSGHMHYQCPACEIVLLVDPTAVLGDDFLKVSSITLCDGRPS